MKKLLLSFVAFFAMAAMVNAAEPLFFYAWDVEGDRGFNFELTTTDGEVYHGTGYSMEGAVNVKGIVVTNADWSVTYGNNEWPELKLDGTPVSLPDDSANGCWMWDNPLTEANHIWFNSAKRVLIVNTSDVNPWGDNGVDAVIVNNEQQAVYYNLQGMRVNAPVSGQLYIRQLGAQCSKVKF